MTEKDFYKITDYIATIIKGSEFENHVYAVGGSVRDLLMRNPIKDIDLVVDLPDGGINLANFLKDSGKCHSVVVYPTYGTAMFHLNEFPEEEIECVMTRGEKYLDKDSRNPVCVFDTLESDAVRRDLTINALYYNVTTKDVYDPTGGVNDVMRHKPVRTTNENPDVVFDDDPLRILRVVRFATRYDLGIEEKTYNSMKKYVDRLDIISIERIQAEFNKILLSKNAVKGIETLVELGAMKYIVPELLDTIGIEQNEYHFGDVFQHTMALIKHYHNDSRFKPELKIVLAILLHDIGKVKTKTVKNGKIHFYSHEFVGAKMSEEILRRLKYDNNTIKEVRFLIQYHMRTKPFGDYLDGMRDKVFNKLAYECGTIERWTNLAIVSEIDNLSLADSHVTHGHYDAMINRLEAAKKMFGYKLPINGEDVMRELNLKPGVVVKNILDKFIKMSFVNPNITRETCLKQLPSVYKQILNENKNVKV